MTITIIELIMSSRVKLQIITKEHIALQLHLITKIEPASKFCAIVIDTN